MKYSYEFKKKCIKIYRKGIIVDIPKGVSKDSFQSQIRYWIRIEDTLGTDALKT